MEYNFDTTSVKKLVWQLGVPAMLAQLFRQYRTKILLKFNISDIIKA